jgi:flagellar protein FlaG
MVEPVSAAKPASVQDSVTGTLSSSYVDNDNVSSNYTTHQLRDEKKKEDTRENIKKVSKETVERTVQALKNYIESNKRSLNISVHEQTGTIMVKVISEKDGKVIREIPPEKFLDLAAKIEELAGSLFNETA